MLRKGYVCSTRLWSVMCPVGIIRDQSGFHLPPEKTGGGLHQLFLGAAGFFQAVRAAQDHSSDGIPVADNGTDSLCLIVGSVVCRNSYEIRIISVGHPVDAVLDYGLQLPADLFPVIVLFAASGGGDDVVPVADAHQTTHRLREAFRVLFGKSGKLADGGIFFQDDLTFPVCIYFQRVALADPQRAPDLLWDDDPAQIIPLCQVKVKKFLEPRKTVENTGFLDFRVIPLDNIMGSDFRHPLSNYMAIYEILMIFKSFWFHLWI